MLSEVLTPRQVAEVFERHDTGRYTNVELASWFGCSEGLIRKLLKEREEGRSRADVSKAPDKSDSLSIKKTESALGAAAEKLEAIIQKCPDTLEASAQLNRTVRTLLNIRKQLKELPKDLKEAAAAVDNEAMERLVALVPEDKQGEFLDIIRGLARSRGQPSPDLGSKEE